MRIPESGSRNVRVHAHAVAALLLPVFRVYPDVSVGHIAVYIGTSLDAAPFPASLHPPCITTRNARPPLVVLILRKVIAMYDRIVAPCLQ